MKPYFIAILFIFLVLVLLLNSDFAYSEVPGWHTTILPPWTIAAFIAIILLALSAIGYFILGKKNKITNKKITVFHIVSTFPAVILLKTGPLSYYFMDPKTTPSDLTSIMNITTIFQIFIIAMFLVGHIIFFVSLTKSLLTNSNT